MLTALSILVHLLVSEFWCQIDSSSKTGSVWDSNLTGNLPCLLLYSSRNAHLSSTGPASTNSGRGKDRSRRNHKNSCCAMCGCSFFLFLLKKEAGLLELQTNRSSEVDAKRLFSRPHRRCWLISLRTCCLWLPLIPLLRLPNSTVLIYLTCLGLGSQLWEVSPLCCITYHRVVKPSGEAGWTRNKQRRNI